MTTSSLRIVVTGLIAQHPLLGGVTWDYLQYPVGLARLGHDVYYLEDSGQWPYNVVGGPSREDWIAYDCTPNVEHLASVMSRFGLGDRWAYRFPIRPRWFGLSGAKRREVIRTADLLINVSGTLRRPQDYRQIRRMAYIDSDPAFSQVKLNLKRGQLKFRRRVDAHDVYFSFGENLSEPIPPTGHRWNPTRQPVVLDEWTPSVQRRDVFTTVMSWTSYKPLTYRGAVFGQKDIEFRRYLGLAARVRPTVLEVALSGTRHVTWESGTEDNPSAGLEAVELNGEWTPRELLCRAGWHVVDGLDACGDIDRYREYIRCSKAEWSVAKNGYVRGRPGWFSCRSACYLAAGRPVVVQDTGFGAVLPVGRGMLTFQTFDEAVAAIEEIQARYTHHARAAREIAEEYFSSDKVLTGLIEVAMSNDG